MSRVNGLSAPSLGGAVAPEKEQEEEGEEEEDLEKTFALRLRVSPPLPLPPPFMNPVTGVPPLRAVLLGTAL